MASTAEEYLVEWDDLEPGMRVARDIENRYGGVLVPAGSILTESTIYKLKELNYFYVHIISEAEEERKDYIKEISEKEKAYREEVEKAAALYKRVKYQEKLDYDEFQNLTENSMELSNKLELDELLAMLRDTDEYTYTHLLNVAILCSIVGKWLGLPEKRIEKLTQAGLLHDVGKAKVPDEILQKPDTLTDEEYEIVKKHSLYGYKIVEDAEFINQEVAQGVLTHHEKFGGQGYPLGLKGGDIPLFGRIMAICDAFDAITAERIYRRKKSPFEALKILGRENFTYYDPELRQFFMDNVPNYFLHETVRLNNKEQGKIVFINPREPGYPIVKVEDEYLDLSENPDIKIEEIIK